MAAIGAIGSLAHLAFAEAVKAVDITAVMPLDFTKLVWSAIIGYLAFAEVPDAWTWLGGTVIFAAVVYIAYREKLVRAGEHANEP
jgi:drug/metabolite transporter (DMT)-like permease